MAGNKLGKWTTEGGSVPVGKIGRTSKGGNTHKMKKVVDPGGRKPAQGRPVWTTAVKVRGA